MTAEPMPSYKTILVTIDRGVGIVTLNRPDQLNAWDWEMSLEMSDAYGRLDRDDDIRAIVLTGAGKAFCAGAALLPEGKNFNSGRREEIARDHPEGLNTADSLRTPVIAAINGAAIGAGITMAMGADIRVAADDAVIGFVFHRRGVIPDGDLLWSLPRQIGYGPAMDLILTGRKITGAEAHRIGLVSRIAPAAEIRDLAVTIAHDIAENAAPLAMAMSKFTAKRLLEESDRKAARAFHDQLFAWSVRQADIAEGVSAFIERRPPRWPLSANADFPTHLFEGGRG